MTQKTEETAPLKLCCQTLQKKNYHARAIKLYNFQPPKSPKTARFFFSEGVFPPTKKVRTPTSCGEWVSCNFQSIEGMDHNLMQTHQGTQQWPT